MMEDVGTSANQLVQLDSNAKIPAVDGSLLTNMSSALSGSSDPTLSTNPSGGVGTKFVNTTSGEIFICTDATAGENIWINVGAGSGNIQLTYQGENYGYAMGGYRAAYTNVIDRWSLTSDGNAADVGDMTVIKIGAAGLVDNSHGYSCGGNGPGGVNADMVERFAFGSSSNAVDIGNLSANHSDDPGSSQSNDMDYGYIHGGSSGNVIERFAFGSSVTGADVGDMLWSQNGIGGNCSPSYGYISGGSHATGALNIQKYAFASSGNSTDVGNMLMSTKYIGENGNSQTYGYAMGGLDPGGYSNVIQKWAYASDSNATDVGNLLYTGNSCNSVSSTDYVYCVGGGNASSQYQHLQKVPFATDGNSTDVGDLTANAQTDIGTCAN